MALTFKEIARIINEQQELQQKYEALLAQRHQLKLAANKTKLAETQQEIEQVSKKLTQVTQVCRNYRTLVIMIYRRYVDILKKTQIFQRI